MTFLVSSTFCKLLRKFHHGKFEKQMEIALEFNGHLGHICFDQLLNKKQDVDFYDVFSIFNIL